MIAKYFNSLKTAVIHFAAYVKITRCMYHFFIMHDYINGTFYRRDWAIFFVPFARFVRGSEKQRRSDCCSFLWKRIGAACGAKKKKSIRRERLKFLYPVWLDCLKERLTSCWNHNHLIWWENTFFRHSKPLKCVSLTRWQNCNV